MNITRTKTRTEQNPDQLESVRANGKPFELSLTWQDGREQVVNLRGLLATRPSLGKLFATSEDFASVEITAWGHGIEWANGVDCAARMLGSIADIQADMTKNGSKAFREWQDAHKLSAGEAGELLGYKSAQIANFRSGKSKLPPAVRIAIHAMDEDPNLFAALYRPSARAEKRAVKSATKKRVIKGVSETAKTKAA